MDETEWIKRICKETMLNPPDPFSAVMCTFVITKRNKILQQNSLGKSFAILKSLLPSTQMQLRNDTALKLMTDCDCQAIHVVSSGNYYVHTRWILKKGK